MRSRRLAGSRALLLAAALFLLPNCGSGSGPTVVLGEPPPEPGPELPTITVGLEPIATGLASPVLLTHSGDGSGRLFVVQQTGQIRVIDAEGTLLEMPFLDLSARMVEIDGFYDERGLLGLAFHPQFAANGKFYVRYSAPRFGTEDDPCFGTGRGCHTSVLSEFVVLGDPVTNNRADSASERIVYSIDQPQFNHDGGHVAFGPDGYLYFSLGDGGGAHDGLADVPPSHGALGHGQDVTTAFGSILRIDVDSEPAPGEQYVIPADNPFVDAFGLDEIYAYGLRNVYRFSFDPESGEGSGLFAADVGQSLFEEVNVIVKGGNYGWVTREGFSCFDPQNPDTPLSDCVDTGPLGEPLLDPVMAYGHDEGLAIVGGHVCRTGAVPELWGKYVFGDWSRSFGDADGRLFAADVVGPNAFVRHELKFGADKADFGHVLLGFGQDEAGALYVLGNSVTSPVSETGTVFKLVPAPEPSEE